MTYVKKRAEKLGIPVIDGQKPLALAVTEADVAAAKKADSKRCALSRAAERLPKVRHAYFFRTVAYLEYARQMVCYILPPSVQKEIVSFDRAQVFAVGVYQLTPPGKLRERLRARDRSGARRVSTMPPTAGGQAKNRSVPRSPTPSKSSTGASELLQRAAATNRALRGNGNAPSVVAATKQPNSKPRKSLVHRSQYVRDMYDPDMRV